MAIYKLCDLPAGMFSDVYGTSSRRWSNQTPLAGLLTENAVAQATKAR
jgi:hypothetical protein